jgi:hypothetical protein
MTVADHCVPPNDGRFWASGNGVFMGTATDPGHDLAYIKVPDGTLPWFWEGTPLIQWTRQVVTPGGANAKDGAQKPYNGMRICTSGAQSGEHCSGTVLGWGHIDPGDCFYD